MEREGRTIKEHLGIQFLKSDIGTDKGGTHPSTHWTKYEETTVHGF